MDKLIDYIMKRNKMETVLATVCGVFIPGYLICFLYFTEWFEKIDFIKMTVLIAGTESFAYVVQFAIFLFTHMIFKKRGREMELIILVPLLLLGLSIHFIIFLGLLGVPIFESVISTLIMSFFIEIIFSTMYEIMLKNEEKFNNKTNKAKSGNQAHNILFEAAEPNNRQV